MVMRGAVFQVLGARRASFAGGLLGLLFTFLVGCNFALDLEKGRLAQDCVEGACLACHEDLDCGQGARCIDHACQMNADAGVRDSGLDAAAPDGEVKPECRLDCGTAEQCVIAGGRASCECLPGHQRVGGLCVECGGDAGSCTPNAVCADADGGLVCTCKPGFEDVRGDGTECLDKCDVKGCLAEVATCSIVAGEAECACIAGYVGDGIESCEFDAECSLLECHEHASCEVVEDTRTCKCKAGYEGDGTQCTNPDDCAPENPCQNGGRCTDGLSVYPCDCAGTGYSGFNCTQDIDECTGVSVCGSGSRCVNEPGSHQCVSCGTGYTASANGLECVDINECQTGTHNCGPHGTCASNTNGSYNCACAAGYTQIIGTDGRPTCTLQGACEAGLDNCVEPEDQGVCTSTGGAGFTCACRTGYSGNGVKQSAGGNGCTDINECTSRTVCGETRRCENTPGGYNCINCPAGYESSADGLTCVDINECTGRSVCGATRRCENTAGSYQCINCPSGHESSSNGLTCIDINECAQGAAAVCGQGATGCSNTVGSYSCTCASGYTGTGTTSCVDINECLAGAAVACGQGATGCSNSIGSYSCSCASGYTGTGTPACVDVNECLPATNPCKNGSSCSNTNGDYHCECVTGWDQKNCDRQRCTASSCGVRQTCANVPNGIQCSCNGDSRCPFGATTSCSGDTERTCVADANGCVYMSSSRVCGASGTTCFNNACGGVCAAGSYRCDSVGNSQRCDSAGAWGSNQACAAPDLVCNRANGLCESSRIDDPVGNRTPSATTRNGNEGDLLATPVVPTEDVEIVTMGVRTTPNSVGGAAILAVYSDVVDANTGLHRPGARIAYTAQFNLSADADNPRILLSSNVRLARNTVYWFAVKLSELATENIQIYRYPARDLGGWSSRYPVTNDPWGSPPMATFSTNPAFNAGEISIYAVVRRYWQ